MKLPDLKPNAAPQFVDAESCKSWLDNVTLANTAAAQADLLGELEVFNSFPAAAASRLAVLEALREAVAFVQVEQAKKFTNRPLPMGETESTAFQDTTELWEQMRIGYLRCLQAAADGDAAMRAQAALITQRLAAYSGLKMFHYFRAYREVPRRDWRSLNEVYAVAERLGVQEESVKDFLNRDVHDSSPRIAYARAVLMGLCSPHELSQRQLTFVAFLLERWASKLEISPEPVAEGEGVPPLVADLASDRLPERTAAPQGGNLRYLDTRKLAKSLRNRVGLLRKGESPAKLALGEDCVQPSCEQTLVFLFRQWCQAKSASTARRAAATAQMCNDLEAIHYSISGGTVRRKVEQKELTQKQRQELETLGRIRTTDDQQPTGVRAAELEEWRIEEDSAQGLHLVRPAAAGGKRFAHGQLVAVRPADASGFILGQVRWLMGADNGDLHAGIKLMPGVPGSTSIKALGLNESERTSLAITLGAVPKLEPRPTLILPLGWFKAGRTVEVTSDKPATIRLTEVVERGSDFERIAYERP